MAKSKLNVTYGNDKVNFNVDPRYLVVTTDSSLITYRPHIEKLAQKIKNQSEIGKETCRYGMGRNSEGTKNNNPSTCLFSSRVLCACLVKQCTYRKKKMDVQLGAAMRIISGTLKSANKD